MGTNPRYSNGAKRREIRRWLLHTQDICALCGKPIDKTLKSPHPMSFEVDEIIPVSKGGSPYDRNNVQATHRICNQRKGNKTIKQGERRTTLNQPLPRSREW